MKVPLIPESLNKLQLYKYSKIFKLLIQVTLAVNYLITWFQQKQFNSKASFPMSSPPWLFVLLFHGLKGVKAVDHSKGAYKNPYIRGLDILLCQVKVRNTHVCRKPRRLLKRCDVDPNIKTSLLLAYNECDEYWTTPIIHSFTCSTQMQRNS